MLGNEVQLFFQLLDSLSNSLRDLAVKYELLVSTTSRQGNSIEKTDVAIADMANEVSSSFTQLSKDFDSLKTFAADSKYQDLSLDSSIETISKLVESTNLHVEALLKASVLSENLSTESKMISLHIDSHMDTFGNQLTAIQSVLGSTIKELQEMNQAIQSMRSQLEPFKKLAILFSKPIPILIGIYFIIATVLAFMKVKSECDNIFNKQTSSITESITKTFDKSANTNFNLSEENHE